jgi:hypothetical protein
MEENFRRSLIVVPPQKTQDSLDKKAEKKWKAEKVGGRASYLNRINSSKVNPDCLIIPWRVPFLRSLG